MTMIEEMRDTLTALLIDRGDDDPTFQRMARVYGEVTELLGQKEHFEVMLRTLLVAYRAQAGQRDQYKGNAIGPAPMGAVVLALPERTAVVATTAPRWSGDL